MNEEKKLLSICDDANKIIIETLETLMIEMLKQERLFKASRIENVLKKYKELQQEVLDI